MGNVEGRRSLKKAYCLDISGFFLRSVELSSSWAFGGNLVDNSRLLLSTEYKLKFWAPIYVHSEPKLRIQFGNHMGENQDLSCILGTISAVS